METLWPFMESTNGLIWASKGMFPAGEVYFLQIAQELFRPTDWNHFYDAR